MMMSPCSMRSASLVTVSPVNAAGTMIHAARGVDSLPTKSSRELDAMPPSLSSCRTESGLTSYTTHSCPPRIRRLTKLAHIRPRPIIPSCIRFSSFVPGTEPTPPRLVLPMLAPRSRLSVHELLGEEPHDVRVHVPPSHELGSSQRPLEPEADLLVGSAAPDVVRIHLEIHALQVHLPEPEPAQCPDGIGPEPAVPVGLRDPDPKVRAAVPVVQVPEVARTDGFPLERLDYELYGVVGPARRLQPLQEPGLGLRKGHGQSRQD